MVLERKSGILAHPTSFESAFGIGDLGSGTYSFIDFLEKSKQKLWQILPLGPTSMGDSPYQCFSTFAGNHMLIDPNKLYAKGYLAQADLVNDNNFDEYKVEYGDVINYKNGLLRKAFENFKNLDAKSKKEYNEFCKKAKWLDDYALFMALKYYFIEERRNTFESPEYKVYKKDNAKTLTENQVNDFFYGAVWNSWPDDIKNREEKALEKWHKTLKDEVELHKFLQYEFFLEWAEVKKYANGKGIDIIGDIPIFVAMDSSDVWANPDLFFLDKKGSPTQVAGVPPDYFSVTGQLWGNPLYNFKNHAKQGYKWWIERIEAMLTLVDIIRIDHFRGFDEYWSIPFGEPTAVNGKWCKGPGKELFVAIEKALGSLPIIAEDLGLMTPTVEALRDELDLPGMKILQFAFDDSEENDYLPHNFKHSNCVVYTGTHDNDTTVGWYKKTTEQDRDHLRRYCNVSGDDVAWDLIRLVWSSIGAYAIAPVQDILALDDDARMNTPGIASGNWQFRFKNEVLNDDVIEKLVYLGKLFDR